MTTTNEHNTHEHPTAANYTAGDSFAKISTDCRKIAADIASAGINGFGNQVQSLIERIEALAASHCERSERDVPNGANCAQGEAEPYAYLSALDGQYADERTSTNFRALLECHRRGKPHWPKGALLLYTAPPPQPADNPAEQADVSQPKVAPASPSTRQTDGWKEATIAWAVCASIHREFAKGKDPFFKTRQADFVRHENDARAALSEAKQTHSCVPAKLVKAEGHHQ